MAPFKHKPPKPNPKVIRGKEYYSLKDIEKLIDASNLHIKTFLNNANVKLVRSGRELYVKRPVIEYIIKNRDRYTGPIDNPQIILTGLAKDFKSKKDSIDEAHKFEEKYKTLKELKEITGKSNAIIRTHIENNNLKAKKHPFGHSHLFFHVDGFKDIKNRANIKTFEKIKLLKKQAVKFEKTHISIPNIELKYKIPAALLFVLEDSITPAKIHGFELAYQKSAGSNKQVDQELKFKNNLKTVIKKHPMTGQIYLLEKFAEYLSKRSKAYAKGGLFKGTILELEGISKEYFAGIKKQEYGLQYDIIKIANALEKSNQYYSLPEVEGLFGKEFKVLANYEKQTGKFKSINHPFGLENYFYPKKIVDYVYIQYSMQRNTTILNLKVLKAIFENQPKDMRKVGDKNNLREIAKVNAEIEQRLSDARIRDANDKRGRIARRKISDLMKERIKAGKEKKGK